MSAFAMPWCLCSWAVAKLLIQHLKGAEDGNGGGKIASGAKIETTTHPTISRWSFSSEPLFSPKLCDSGWWGLCSAIRQINCLFLFHLLSACLGKQGSKNLCFLCFLRKEWSIWLRILKAISWRVWAFFMQEIEPWSSYLRVLERLRCWF